MITYGVAVDLHVLERRNEDVAQRNDILVSEVLEELELTVCALGQDGGAEGLHDLLDGDILVCQLIAGGAVFTLSVPEQ